MRPLNRLWVVYDSSCGLCSRIKDWISRQPAFLPLELVAAGSVEALAKFPQLPAGELAVVGDQGDVWFGNRAWIVVLWALRDYREWAVRLSNPLLTPLAKQAFTAVSANRVSISKLLGLRGDQEIQQYLKEVEIPGCEIARK